MATPTIRTTTHSYPQEEINAMRQFYGGKRCIITKTTLAVNWCHMLDAALETSTSRLSEMLSRKLPSSLFLHEDVLARTPAYEQDLQAWRIAELEAGRADPGRPAYDEVFGGEQETQHRYHCAGIYPPIAREEGNGGTLYYSRDCPGIDDPASRNHFPIIKTLLSIPFSLIHNFPRLATISPHNTHQHQLIRMGSEILRLWWWDPPPEMIKQSREIRRNLNFAANQHNNTPNAKPYPIHHQSRTSTTFLMEQPTLAFGAHTKNSPSHNLDPGERGVERHLGPIFLGTPTHLDWLTDGMLPTDGDSEGLTKEDLQREDDSIMADVTGSPVTSEACTKTEDPDDISDSMAIQDKPAICPSSLDIVSWSQTVVHSAPEPLLAPTPTPFERGVIASMSVNDILMVKGLISPPVYLQFLNLNLFPCL